MGESSDTEYVGTDVVIPTRVSSADYGKGNIVADFDSMGVQIYWDKPITGTMGTHLLVHDRAWVARLEKLPPELPQT
jgi:hypothetical protein